MEMPGPFARNACQRPARCAGSKLAKLHAFIPTADAVRPNARASATISGLCWCNFPKGVRQYSRNATSNSSGDHGIRVGMKANHQVKL